MKMNKTQHNRYFWYAHVTTIYITLKKKNFIIK